MEEEASARTGDMYKKGNGRVELGYMGRMSRLGQIFFTGLSCTGSNRSIDSLTGVCRVEKKNRFVLTSGSIIYWIHISMIKSL